MTAHNTDHFLTLSYNGMRFRKVVSRADFTLTTQIQQRYTRPTVLMVLDCTEINGIIQFINCVSFPVELPFMFHDQVSDSPLEAG